MIDRFLSRQGVGLALFFITTELAYINSLSLKFMFNNGWIYDLIFGIIGAIGYSIVTVLIMRLAKQKWLTFVFPFFDAVLMFGGFNLRHQHDLLDDPIRFGMSIFLSLFSGLITYSLGQINADQHEAGSEQSKITSLESDKANLESELTKIKGILESIQRNYDKLNSDYKLSRENEKLLQSKMAADQSKSDDVQSIFAEMKSDLDDTIEKLNETKSELKVTREKADRYEKIALASEAARIRKKAEKNRTAEDKELLAEIDRKQLSEAA